MGSLNDALEVLCLAQCHTVPCGIMWHDMFRDVLVWLLLEAKHQVEQEVQEVLLPYGLLPYQMEARGNDGRLMAAT